MAWIESHQTLQRHPKVIGLAAKSRLSKAAVIGHLQMLWWWAMDYAPTGDLSPFAPEMVAAAAEWEGPAVDWISMLKEFRWVDPDGRLHDWDQYAGRLLEIRQKDRKRKSEGRLERAHRNSNGHPADVQRTSIAIPTYPTQPNPTQPNQPSTHTPSPREGESESGAGEEQAYTPPGPVTQQLAEHPAWAEVQAHCATIGLPEWKARMWFDDMEAAGWHHKGQRVRAWRPLLNTVRTWWEADGKPMAPPARGPIPAQDGASQKTGSSDWGDIKKLELVEAEIKAVRGRGTESALGTTYSTKDAELLKELIAKRKEIKGRLLA